MDISFQDNSFTDWRCLIALPSTQNFDFQFSPHPNTYTEYVSPLMDLRITFSLTLCHQFKSWPHQLPKIWISNPPNTHVFGFIVYNSAILCIKHSYFHIKCHIKISLSILSDILLYLSYKARDYIFLRTQQTITPTRSITYHVSCIMYHVSCIMCHVSCIMYHVPYIM